MPTVTVLIPAYNAGALLGSAIQSALRQTWRDLEVLVVNDGSTDDTATQALAYGPSVRLLNVPHGGLASARNHGMRAAGGRFIVFLDADDILEETLVASAVELLERRPDLAFVFCNVRFFSQEGQRTEPRLPASLSGGTDEAVLDNPLVDVLLSGYPISSSGLCATRDRLAEAGFFDESLWGSEDFEYWSRMYLRRPVGYLAAPLARIRRHQGNMTRQADRMIHSMAAARGKVIESCLRKGRPELAGAVHRFMRWHMTSAVRNVLGEGATASARRLLWQYRHEMFGIRFLFLAALSCCPAFVLRTGAQLRSLVLRRPV